MHTRGHSNCGPCHALDYFFRVMEWSIRRRAIRSGNYKFYKFVGTKQIIKAEVYNG